MNAALLEILSSNEIKQVHDATLNVLGHTGVQVKSDPCLRIPEDYLETGHRRPSTLKDVADLTRLVDAIPNVAEG